LKPQSSQPVQGRRLLALREAVTMVAVAMAVETMDVEAATMMLINL
jgi:hypothetical protein